MTRHALALLAAIVTTQPAQPAGFVVTAPSPDTEQHQHARAATMLAALAACAAYFPVDAAEVERRRQQIATAGFRLPGFLETYGRVVQDRAREIAAQGDRQWCENVRAIFVEGGLSHLFPGFNPFESDMPAGRRR